MRTVALTRKGIVSHLSIDVPRCKRRVSCRWLSNTSGLRSTDNFMVTLAIRFEPKPNWPKTLACLKLCGISRYYPYVVAISATHRLATADMVRLAELGDEGLITTQGIKARYVQGNFRPYLKKAGIQLKTVQEVNELHAILGLVAGGLGIALFPQSITKLQLEGVVYKELHPGDTPMAEMLIAKRSNDRSATATRFMEMAKTFYKPGR